MEQNLAIVLVAFYWIFFIVSQNLTENKKRFLDIHPDLKFGGPVLLILAGHVKDPLVVFEIEKKINGKSQLYLMWNIPFRKKVWERSAERGK